MLSRISHIGLVLALLAPLSAAQGVKKDGAKDKKQPVTVGQAKKEKEKVRVLKPRDVPGELLRLKSKADIKAEITIRTTTGRPVTFKGVIRNGKLIERIEHKRFVPQKDLAKPLCGVRVWWSGNTDGFIFFRYEVIKSLKITGKLTAAERREIMRRLRAAKEGKDGAKKAAADPVAKDLEKLSPAQLKSVLMRRYPYKDGWNHKKMRALKRKKLIENKPLTQQEEIFVKYFSILVEAHFEDLKTNTKKIEIEPNSAEKKKDGKSAADDGKSDDK